MKNHGYPSKGMLSF